MDFSRFYWSQLGLSKVNVLITQFVNTRFFLSTPRQPAFPLRPSVLPTLGKDCKNFSPYLTC